MFNFSDFTNDYHKLIDKSRLLKLPKLENVDNAKYTAVILETRKLHHIEFILRKAVNHLDSNWSLIFMTSTANYKYYTELSNNIDTNIRVIDLKLPETISIDDYSLIFMSLNFWNLIPGSKVLIFQSDSLILKSNINKFIKYDYIGAPWPIDWNICVNHCGNGGLSLRTKSKMIEIINKFNHSDTLIPDYVNKWMNCSGLKIIPEDVYFSINIHKIDSKLPSRKTAEQFSFEGIWLRSHNTFGCHRPIFIKDHHKQLLLELQY